MCSTSEYDLQQQPYVINPLIPVNVSTVVGSNSSFMIGPIVVKNLDIDIDSTSGQLCQYMMNGSTVGCCDYLLDGIPDHDDHVLTTPCRGELKDWHLILSITCESGYLEYSFLKQGVHMDDRGKYWIIINSTVIVQGFRAAVVDVRNVANSRPPSVESNTLESQYLAIIITLAVLLAVVLCASCVAVCLLTGWKKCRKADPEVPSLLDSSEGFIDMEGV